MRRCAAAAAGVLATACARQPAASTGAGGQAVVKGSRSRLVVPGSGPSDLGRSSWSGSASTTPSGPFADGDPDEEER